MQFLFEIEDHCRSNELHCYPQDGSVGCKLLNPVTITLQIRGGREQS